MTDPFTDPLSPALLAKIGSILVHADEHLSVHGHEFDRLTMKALLDDVDVRAFIEALGPLVPKKRNP